MAVEIPPWLDPAETLLFAAAYIKCGRVKFCPPTIDKTAIHPLGAALNFKADDPVEAVLQGAFLAAISLSSSPAFVQAQAESLSRRQLASIVGRGKVISASLPEWAVASCKNLNFCMARRRH